MLYEIISDKNKKGALPDGLFCDLKYKAPELTLVKIFNKVLKASGVNKKIRFYDLRHSSIQKFVELYGWTHRTAAARLDDYLARSKVLLPNGEDLLRERLKKQEEIMKQLIIMMIFFYLTNVFFWKYFYIFYFSVFFLSKVLYFFRMFLLICKNVLDIFCLFF